MPRLPEDKDSASDGEENRGSRLQNKPTPLPVAEDAESDVQEEANPELPVETDERFSDGALEKTPSVLPLFESPRPSEKEISQDSNEDHPTDARPRIPKQVESETFREVGGGISGPLAVTGVDTHEQLDQEPFKEAKPHETEDTIMESLKKSDQGLPKDTEVLGPTVRVISVGSQEEAPEVSLTKPDRTTPEPLEPTEREVLSGKRRKSTEKLDLQPPEMTTPDILGEAQRKTPEEEGAEPSEQVKPELPEEEPRKSTEEAAQEPLEETKAEVPEEIGRTSPKELGAERLEQTNAEFPVETQKPSEKFGTESCEHLRPEFPEGEPRKPIEEIAQEPLEETRAETPDKFVSNFISVNQK